MRVLRTAAAALICLFFGMALGETLSALEDGVMDRGGWSTTNDYRIGPWGPCREDLRKRVGKYACKYRGNWATACRERYNNRNQRVLNKYQNKNNGVSGASLRDYEFTCKTGGKKIFLFLEGDEFYCYDGSKGKEQSRPKQGRKGRMCNLEKCGWGDSKRWINGQYWKDWLNQDARGIWGLNMCT